MKLDGVRQKVFLDRYSLKDKEGKPLEKTPDEMWRRVAKGIAGQEKKSLQKTWEKKFYDVMTDFKFVPGGRILSGAGTDFQVTYFNCFVIPSPKDSREGILDSLKQLVEIQSRSGGVGLNLSSLRPRGARVKKVNGFSSGPVTWAGLFSYATHDVVQQGGSRRGATMLMLHDWHPDVEEFITVKQDLSQINGANLSVCVSDEFMKAVKNDADWKLEFPDLDDPHYDKEWDGDLSGWKERKRKVKVYKTIKASALWDLICTAAWRSAEPGLHFLERSNKRSNTWYFEKLIATNPCGEQPLGEWAVCNLGAMNLSAYVTSNGQFDYKSFEKDVRVSMRFLDNVIDDTYYFFKENEKAAKDIRRTGLGILGLADALIKMKLRYGSPESEETLKKIFETLRNSAYDASADIAKEKSPFPKFKAKMYLKGWHIEKLPQEIRKKIAKNGIRNAVLLTIAPTGTTSLISGVSSGVEPVYEFELIRRDRLGEHKMYHPLFETWEKDHPTAEKPDYFVSANDLTPEEHVMVQAIAQEYIDSSISKTVNAPNGHSVEDVKSLYMMAYDKGLKGVTYMREGSREGVLSRVDTSTAPSIGGQAAQEKQEIPATLPKEFVRAPRPMMVEGVTYKTETPAGDTYITLNHDSNHEPFEVFITIGKTGSDVAAMADALGRMISLNLRLAGNLPPRERIRRVISQLSGIGGARSIGFGENRVRSLPDAVAKVLAKQYAFRINGVVEDKLAPGVSSPIATPPVDIVGTAEKEEITVLQQLPLAEGITIDTKPKTHSYDICPECGVSSFVYEEGCGKCYTCGHSEC